MGGGAGGGRELDQTPTWAVAAVCAVIVVISIALEKVLHHVGEYFQEKRKKALFEALEKIKGELMVLGFISLLLTFGQNFISNICIREELAFTMLPCQRVSHSTDSAHLEPSAEDHEGEHHRRLLWNEHRVLSADSPPAGCKAGQLPLISVHGLHQLHIFIFFLAVFHVINSAITMMLGRLKIREWKDWEREVLSREEATRDPARFRLTHETSFVRENASFWIKTPFLFYITCFFRQFFRSVRRSDYLTLRHGFINYFRAYSSLMLVVPAWQAMTWLSVLPLLVILAVGTKLQAIIAAMAVEITERHAVVQGMPLIQVSDSYFWLSWPQLILYLIHYVLFQNAFEITYFFWIWYEFGVRSCFHSNFPLTIARVALGITVQITCSYITLPLYALVTQMGSNMKQSIFDEQTSKALRKWHKNAKKKNEVKPGGMPTQTLGESGDAEADTPGKEQEMAKVTASVDLEEKLSPPRDLLTGS
ncbi:hypothetical protein Droror1_Dr00015698 [Drosera rotundifolia]